MDYNIIKRNYDKGLWSKAMVEKAIEKGVISQEEFEEITTPKEKEETK